MMTLEQFGQSIQAKYPAYAKMTPTDVGTAVLQKYPQYKSQVTQTPTNTFNAPTPTYKASNPLLNNFIGTLGQGISTAIRTITGKTNQAGQTQAAGLQQDMQLVKAIHAPNTTPANQSRLLLTLTRNQTGQPTQAQIDPGTGLTSRDVIGSSVKLASLAAPSASDSAGFFGLGDAVGKGRSPQGTAAETIFSALGGKLLEAGTTALLNKVAPKISEALEKINLRLTPSQKSNFSTAANDAANWLSENKVVGTPTSRFEKVSDIYDKAEDTLQNFLNTTAKDVKVSTQDLAQKLDELKPQYKNDADSLDIDKQIDRAKVTLQSKQGQEVAVSDLNQLKRSVYKNAYNQAGTKVRDDVESAIGDIYRKAIENATQGMKVAGKDIGDFNKEYGRIINVRKFLKVAQGRNQLGWIGRFISGSFGAATSAHFGGGPIADTAAFAGGEIGANMIAGTLPRSAAAAGLRTLSDIAPKGASSAAGRLAGPLISSLSPKQKSKTPRTKRP